MIPSWAVTAVVLFLAQDRKFRSAKIKHLENTLRSSGSLFVATYDCNVHLMNTIRHI